MTLRDCYRLISGSAFDGGLLPESAIGGRSIVYVVSRHLLSMKADQPLAEVFPPVKLGDGSRAMLDAIANILAISQLSGANPVGKARYRFLETVNVVKNEQAAHARSLHKQMPLDSRPLAAPDPSSKPKRCRRRQHVHRWRAGYKPYR